MKIRFLFLFLTISLVMQSQAENRYCCQTTPREKLLCHLKKATQENKVLFGHHDDPVYGHSWKWDTGRSDVLETTGSYPAIMSWDLGGIENGDTVNLDGVPFSRIRSEAIAHDGRGGINTFSWHATKPFGEGSSWEVNDTTVVNRILNDDSANKWFTDAVGNIAKFFNSLEDKDGKEIAVIFRPWHEHTGSWFWWGTNWCTPAQYRNLWHETRRIMDSNDADNVVWAYSPDRVNSLNQYMERYPGDKYVDIMGTDVYHFDGEKGTQTYIRDASASLEAATEAARKHGKIAAFTETGCESLPIQDWFTSILLPIVKNYPVAYVTVWRNAHDKENHFYTPYKGHQASDDFKKFHDDTSTVFVSR